MQQKAFGQFPAGNGAYQFIDVLQIEGIGQSLTPEVAVVFMVGSDRHYTVELTSKELAASGEPDAANWCLSLVCEIASKGNATKVRDSKAPTGPALFGGDPNMPL